MEKENIKALYGEDADNIEEVLERLGVLEDFSSGRIECGKCGKPLNIDNLGCITSQDNEIILYCKKKECIRSV